MTSTDDDAIDDNIREKLMRLYLRFQKKSQNSSFGEEEKIAAFEAFYCMF